MTCVSDGNRFGTFIINEMWNFIQHFFANSATKYLIILNITFDFSKGEINICKVHFYYFYEHFGLCAFTTLLLDVRCNVWLPISCIIPGISYQHNIHHVCRIP